MDSRVLSTAGTGIIRDNEVVEAKNNINRFITIDKVKRKDSERLSRSQSHSILEPPPAKSYNLVKEEQIKVSQDRANFHNKARNLVAKSPQPFRRGLSETRAVERPEPTSNGLNNLNDNQKAKLIQVRLEVSTSQRIVRVFVEVLLDQLPNEVGDKLVAERISSLSINPTRLYNMSNQLHSEVRPSEARGQPNS